MLNASAYYAFVRQLFKRASLAAIRLRLELAERAVDRPFTPAASRRIDGFIVRAETA